MTKWWKMPAGSEPLPQWVYWLYVLIVAIVLYYATYTVSYGVDDFALADRSIGAHLASLWSWKGAVALVFFAVALDFFIQGRFWGMLFWVPFMLYQTLRVYMYYCLGISEPSAYIGIFLGTDWEEARSYLTFGNSMWLMASILANAGIYLFGRFLIVRCRRSTLRWVPAAEAAFLAGWVSMVECAYVYLCPPYDSFVIAVLDAQKTIRKGGELATLKMLPKAAEGESSLVPRGGPVTVIFIVGESVRADHLQVCGYGRRTTPLLVARKQSGELAVFPHTVSFDTSTEKSVIGMLTNATNGCRVPTVGSFVSLFRKHDFQTAFFYNMRREATPPMMLLTADCGERYFSDSFLADGILSRVKGMLAEGDVNRLIVLQTKGSHYHYSNKYPQERFAVFLPDEHDRDLSMQKPDLVNAYDNSILYLDYFLDSLMELSRDKNVVLVYCSDHGESFGEGGRYLHGGTLSMMEQRRVPLLVWCSSAYRERNPRLWENLIRRQGGAAEHGNLFHTVLGLAGIWSVWYESALDLSAEEAAGS